MISNNWFENNSFFLKTLINSSASCRKVNVNLTFDEDEPLPKKVSLRWADILDHLDVHWFLPDVAAYMRMYPIPNVLNMIEQAAADELLSPRGINTNS